MRSMFLSFWLAATLPAFAASGAKNDWDRLSRVSKLQTVKVNLRNGRVLKGRIQQFDLDGIRVAEEKNWSRFKARDFEAGLTHKSGETVDLRLRSGAPVQGVVMEVNTRDNEVSIIETTRLTHVDRADVAKVTKRTHLGTAAIGAAAGAPLILLTDHDSLGRSETLGGRIAGDMAVGALLGAAVGAIVGRTVTIYDAR
jgi:hypothetical protein